MNPHLNEKKLSKAVSLPPSRANESKSSFVKTKITAKNYVESTKTSITSQRRTWSDGKGCEEHYSGAAVGFN